MAAKAKVKGWSTDELRYDGYLVSDLERKFMRALRIWQFENKRGLPPFAFQYYPYDGKPGHAFEGIRVDFAWPLFKLIVECQGGQFTNGGHNRGRGMARDYDRHNQLTSDGWRVFYFATTHLDENPLGAVQILADVFESIMREKVMVTPLPDDITSAKVNPSALWWQDGNFICWHNWQVSDNVKTITVECDICGAAREFEAWRK